MVEGLAGRPLKKLRQTSAVLGPHRISAFTAPIQVGHLVSAGDHEGPTATIEVADHL